MVLNSPYYSPLIFQNSVAEAFYQYTYVFDREEIFSLVS